VAVVASPRADRGVDRSLKTATTHQTHLRCDRQHLPNQPRTLQNPIPPPSRPTSYGSDFHWVSVFSKNLPAFAGKIPHNAIGSAMHMERLTQPFFHPLISRRKPISLISHSDVRYRGILAGIDPTASTIQLSNGQFVRPYPGFNWRSLVRLTRPEADTCFLLSSVLYGNRDTTVCPWPDSSTGLTPHSPFEQQAARAIHPTHPRTVPIYHFSSLRGQGSLRR
jgi:hypothetical protein